MIIYFPFQWQIKINNYSNVYLGCANHTKYEQKFPFFFQSIWICGEPPFHYFLTLITLFLLLLLLTGLQLPVQLSVSQPDDSIILWEQQLFREESVIFNGGMALRPFGKKCWGKWPQRIKGPFISWGTLRLLEAHHSPEHRR